MRARNVLIIFAFIFSVVAAWFFASLDESKERRTTKRILALEREVNDHSVLIRACLDSINELANREPEGSAAK